MMSKKSFSANYFTLIPLVFSGILCIFLVYLLDQKTTNTPAFFETLQDQISTFIGISGFTAIVLIGYIVFSIFGSNRLLTSGDNKLNVLINKMNAARKIIEIIYKSKLWLPEVKTFIDDEFEGLSFFDVKEFYKGKSKLAIDYLEEKKGQDDTDTLYLELKSLLYTEPKQKSLPNTIIYPLQYNPAILEKWLEHKIGSGLWYHFGYRFGDFKNALNLDALHERHQDKIIALANTIDPISFEDSSFNDVFLSKFGEYLNKDLIPKLFEAQSDKKNGLSTSLQNLYVLFAAMVFIGMLLPLLSTLLELPTILLVCSFSFVISALVFMVISGLSFLSKTVNS
jgi:hypothetical protein